MPWQEYNPSPIAGNGVDCTVRALTKALNISWEKAYTMLAVNGFAMGDMPSANHVFNATMRQNGFKRYIIPDSCSDCYTAEDFAEEHPEGIYVLAFGDHVCAVVDGTIWDSWDSRWRVPMFYWEKASKDSKHTDDNSQQS